MIILIIISFSEFLRIGLHVRVSLAVMNPDWIFDNNFGQGAEKGFANLSWNTFLRFMYVRRRNTKPGLLENEKSRPLPEAAKTSGKQAAIRRAFIKVFLWTFAGATGPQLKAKMRFQYCRTFQDFYDNNLPFSLSFRILSTITRAKS